MKAHLQIAASLLALAGLLGGAASNATSIAELPLKASVLAKPNVIFGLDDSGSMDSEVMLNNNDGAFWWDYNAGSGWNASGRTWFNDVGDASTQWRKMVYLFPNGTATGARIYSDAGNDHFAIMPSAQLAFVRSSDYNPIYYNSSASYPAWSPAYVSGALTNYANATATAAQSHPVYGTAVTTNLTADVALTTGANLTFIALPGMVVPQNAQYCTHNGSGGCTGGWTTVTATAGHTVPAATVLRVAMAYYPATFYKKESCTLSAPTCVAAPDGATLKRYEIKSGNSFPSGRSYADEIQNFANWFQYYRKRKIMLSAAIGKVLEPQTGLRLGVVHFNSNSTVTMYDTDATSAASNGRRVAGIFYATNGNGGTPTRETLKYIGDQYMNTSGVIQYACQRNNAFVVTDGFANVSNVTPPSYSQATWGSGAPYQTIYDHSLADIALSYYTNNLKSTLATGRVPSNTTDANTNLHMNTYGLTLGAKGTIFVDESTPVPTSTSAWPNPSSNRSPTAVDDLWHATINGRGKMYTAATPAETALRIQAALNDVLSALGAQGGVAVSTVNLSRGDGFAYLGSYNPAGWSGDLTANTISSTSGAIATTATWSASAKLTARDWTTRVIATSNGSGGVAFTEAGVGTIVNPSGTWGTTSQLMNYLRGDRSLEGTTYRTRVSLMGAVMNAEPVISAADNVVYAASGEGMLHAFDIAPGANVGKELWAFVPRAVLPDIGQTAARGYTFKTQLDGTPVIGSLGGSSKLLVAGMGAAGNSYYALDVSAPRSIGEGDLSWVKWQFPAVGDGTNGPKVGQTMGRPLVVKTTAGYRVLVTSGYNNTFDGKGRLFVLDPANGSVLKEFATTAGTLAAESGLTHVTGYHEDDGTVRYVYGGDLLGNLWRFDLDAAAGTDANLVAALKNASGVAQPVTAAPDLAYISGKRVVLVGTGRLLDVGDFGNSSVQSFYAIADGATLANARAGLVARTYDRSAGTLTGATINWATDRGWFFDLPSGEQVNTRPTVARGSVSFTSNVTGTSDCSASSWFYVVDFGTGLQSSSVDFVSQQVSATANVSSPLAVGLSGQGAGSGDPGGPGGPGPGTDCPGGVIALMQTTDGKPFEKCIAKKEPIQPAKNSWREIRRQ